jgi:hypothetical protein
MPQALLAGFSPRVRSRGTPCGIFGRLSGTGIGFSHSTRRIQGGVARNARRVMVTIGESKNIYIFHNIYHI